MKTLLYVIALISVIGAAKFTTSYMFDAVQTKRAVDTVNKRADDPKSEPVVSRDTFMKEFMIGCDTGEYNGERFNQTTYCKCMFNELESKYGLNYLIKSGLNDTAEQIQNKYENEMVYCVNLQLNNEVLES